MIDAAELESGSTSQAAIGAGLEHRMTGYCAGCGTWDAHGLSCVSCGYDFTADAGAEPSISKD